jgi:hypothetical protein
VRRIVAAHRIDGDDDVPGVLHSSPTALTWRPR